MATIEILKRSENAETVRVRGTIAEQVLAMIAMQDFVWRGWRANRVLADRLISQAIEPAGIEYKAPSGMPAYQLAQAAQTELRAFGTTIEIEDKRVEIV